mmetsp:Transcript_80/g.115  ORF Transcript_80/g.115 Transcript_80/m.115 type:complete len:144 (+) Transcript_80:287-718(+)
MLRVCVAFTLFAVLLSGASAQLSRTEITGQSTQELGDTPLASIKPTGSYVVVKVDDDFDIIQLSTKKGKVLAVGSNVAESPGMKDVKVGDEILFFFGLATDQWTSPVGIGMYSLPGGASLIKGSDGMGVILEYERIAGVLTSS